MEYVIFWGYDKHKSPVWEANITITDEEPIDPNDDKVIKFQSKEAANQFLTDNYTGVEIPEILDMEEATDIYLDLNY